MKSYSERLAEFIREDMAALGRKRYSKNYTREDAERRFRASEGFRDVAPGETEIARRGIGAPVRSEDIATGMDLPKEDPEYPGDPLIISKIKASRQFLGEERMGGLDVVQSRNERLNRELRFRKIWDGVNYNEAEARKEFYRREGFPDPGNIERNPDQEENYDDSNPLLSVLRSARGAHVELPSSTLKAMSGRAYEYGFNVYKGIVETRPGLERITKLQQRTGVTEASQGRLGKFFEEHEENLRFGYNQFILGEEYDDPNYGLNDRPLLQKLLHTPLFNIGIDPRRIGQDILSRLESVKSVNIGGKGVEVKQSDLAEYRRGAQFLIEETPRTVADIHNLNVRASMRGLAMHLEKMLEQGADILSDSGSLFSAAVDAARTVPPTHNPAEWVTRGAFYGVTGARRREYEDLSTVGGLAGGIEVSDVENDVGYTEFGDTDDLYAGPFRNAAGDVVLSGLFTKGGTLLSKHGYVNKIEHEPRKGWSPLVIRADQGNILTDVYKSAVDVQRKKLRKEETRFGNTPVGQWLERLNPYLGHLRGEEKLPTASDAQIARFYTSFDITATQGVNLFTGTQTKVNLPNVLSPHEHERQLAETTLRRMRGVYPIGLFGQPSPTMVRPLPEGDDTVYPMGRPSDAISYTMGPPTREVVDVQGNKRSYLPIFGHEGDKFRPLSETGGPGQVQVALSQPELYAISRFSDVEFFNRRPDLIRLASTRKIRRLLEIGLINDDQAKEYINDPFRGTIRKAGLGLLKAHHISSRSLKSDTQQSFNEELVNELVPEDAYDDIWGNNRNRGSYRRAKWEGYGYFRVGRVDYGQQWIAPDLDGSGNVFMDLRTNQTSGRPTERYGDPNFTRWAYTRSPSRRAVKQFGATWEKDPENILGYNVNEYEGEEPLDLPNVKEQQFEWYQEAALASNKTRRQIVENIQAYGSDRAISVTTYDPYTELMAFGLATSGMYINPKSAFNREEMARRNQIFSIGTQAAKAGIFPIIPGNTPKGKRQQMLYERYRVQLEHDTLTGREKRRAEQFVRAYASSRVVSSANEPPENWPDETYAEGPDPSWGESPAAAGGGSGTPPQPPAPSVAAEPEDEDPLAGIRARGAAARAKRQKQPQPQGSTEIEEVVAARKRIRELQDEISQLSKILPETKAATERMFNTMQQAVAAGKEEAAKTFDDRAIANFKEKLAKLRRGESVWFIPGEPREGTVPVAAAETDRDSIKEKLARLIANGAPPERLLGGFSENDRKSILYLAKSIILSRSDVTGVDADFAAKVQAEIGSADPDYNIRRALALGGKEFLQANYPEFERDYLGKGWNDKSRANFDAWMNSLPEDEREKVKAAIDAVYLEQKGSSLGGRDPITVTREGYTWEDRGLSGALGKRTTVWSQWSDGRLDPYAYPGANQNQSTKGAASATIGRKVFYKIIDPDGEQVFVGELDEVKKFYSKAIDMNAANRRLKIMRTDVEPGSMYKVMREEFRDVDLPSSVLPYDTVFPKDFKGYGMAIRGNLSYIREPSGGFLDPDAFENKYATQDDRNAHVIDLRGGAAAHETGHHIWWSLEDARSKVLKKFDAAYKRYKDDSRHLARTWEAEGKESNVKEEFSQAFAVANTMGIDALRSTHPDYAEIFEKHSEELKLAEKAAPPVVDYTDPDHPIAFSVVKEKQIKEIAGIEVTGRNNAPENFEGEQPEQRQVPDEGYGLREVGNRVVSFPQSRQARVEIGAAIKARFNEYTDDLAPNRLIGVGKKSASISQVMENGNPVGYEIISRVAGEKRTVGSEEDVNEAIGMARKSLSEAFEAGNLSDDPQLFISEIKKRAMELVRDMVGKTMDRTLESSNEIDVKEVVQKFDAIGKVAGSVVDRVVKTMENVTNSELGQEGKAYMSLKSWELSGTAHRLGSVAKIDKMMEAFPEFREHIQEKFPRGGSLAAASSGGGYFMTSEGIAFSYGSMIPGRGTGLGGAKTVSGVLSAMGLTTASKLVREQEASKIAEYMMSPEQLAEYQGMQEETDRRKAEARASDVSKAKLQKYLGDERNVFDPNEVTLEEFRGALATGQEKIAQKEAAATLKETRQDQLATLGITASSVKSASGKANIYKLDEEGWNQAVSSVLVSKESAETIAVAQTQAKAASPDAFARWKTEVAKTGVDVKSVMPNVEALAASQTQVDAVKLAIQQADIPMKDVARKLGTLDIFDKPVDEIMDAIEQVSMEKEAPARARALAKARRGEARRRGVPVAKAKERFDVEDLSEVEDERWDREMPEMEAEQAAEKAIDFSHKKARAIAPEAYGQWAKSKWAEGVDPSTLQAPEFDVQGKRRGFGLLSDPGMRFMFQAFAAKRAWSMFSAPIMAASEQYGMQSSQYAMFEGEGVTAGTAGYAARKQAVDTYMARGAFEQFGETSKGAYILSRLDTEGVFPRVKAGLQWSAGLAGAGYMAAVGGAALAGMGGIMGGASAAMSFLGPAGLIAGGTLAATTLGMEAYNQFFKPADKKAVSWGSIVSGVAEDIAIHKYDTAEAKALRAEADDILTNRVETAMTVEEQEGLIAQARELRARADEITIAAMPEDIGGAIKTVDTGGAARVQALVQGTGGTTGLAGLTGQDEKELTGAFMQTAKYYGVTDRSLGYMDALTRASVKNYRTTSETQQTAAGIAQATGVRMGTAEYQRLETQIAGMSAVAIDNLQAKTGQYARYGGALSGYFADSRDAMKFAAEYGINTDAKVRGIQSILGAASTFGFDADTVVGYKLTGEDVVSGGRRVAEETPVLLRDEAMAMTDRLGTYKSQLAAGLQSTLMAKGVDLMPAMTAFEEWGLQTQTQAEFVQQAISQTGMFGYGDMDAYSYGRKASERVKGLGQYKASLALSLQTALQEQGVETSAAMTAFQDWGLTSPAQVQVAQATMGQATSFGYTGMDVYNFARSTVGLNQWQQSTLSGAGNRMFEAGISAGGVGSFYQQASGLSNADMSLMSRMAAGDQGAWSWKAWQDGTYANRWFDQAGRPIYQYNGADYMRLGITRAVTGDPVAQKFFGKALEPYMQPNMASSITGMDLGREFSTQGIGPIDPVQAAMTTFGLSQEYAQAFAGEGFTTAAGQTFTGTTAMNMLYAQKQFGFQMAGAGLQLAQLNAQRAFYWGDGSWDNPAPGSMWNLEDQMKALQRSSTLANFAAQEQRMVLGNQFAISQENLNLQRMNVGQEFQRWSMGFDYQSNLMQRGWAREDYAYGRQMTNLQFGWQMEDMDEQLRMTSGRERRLLLRQKERATLSYNLDTGHAEDVQSRQEEMWAREDERYQKNREYQEELMRLDREGFDLSKSQREEFYRMDEQNLARQRDEYEAQYKLQEKMTEKQREHQAEMMDFQEQQIGLQAAAAAAAYEHQINMASVEETYKEIAGANAEILKNDPTAVLDAIAEFGIRLSNVAIEMGGPSVGPNTVLMGNLVNKINSLNTVRLQMLINALGLMD